VTALSSAFGPAPRHGLLDFAVAPSVAREWEPARRCQRILEMDRVNDVWTQELRQPGPRREAALADLRAGMLGGLRGALAGRVGADDAFLEDAVQEALLKVLDRLDTFEGRGRFVSWALAIAVRVAKTATRRKRWQGVSLDRFKDERSNPALDVADHSPGPERASLRSELLAAMHRVIQEQLTDKQWLALTAELNGMPQDEIARQLGSNRNAVYKLTHDARRKLKAGLEAAGFDAESCLEAWER
jgi:RNA polymerase sigma-70 factor, ECF subfamily